MTMKTFNAYSASLLILLLATLPTAGHAADTQAGGTQFRRAVPKAAIATTLPTGTTSCADLGAMDQNQDGKVTASDAAWTKLKLWIDANGDHKVSSGELTSLTNFGASALNRSGGCGTYIGSNGAMRQIKANSQGKLVLDGAGNGVGAFSDGVWPAPGDGLLMR